MAPFRIEKVRYKSVGEETPADKIRSYLDRLMRMIPGEVVALYLVGIGTIPKDEDRLWLVGWTLVCLIGLFAIRIFGSSDKKTGHPPQWVSIFISAGAFLIWVYTLGGPFAAYGMYKPFVGSLLVLAWTFFIPIFYTGD